MIITTLRKISFERDTASREAHRKSQKLFPLVDVVDKHGGVPYTLNIGTLFFYHFFFAQINPE